MKKATILAALVALPALHAVDLPLSAQRITIYKDGVSRVQLQASLPEATQLELKNLPVPISGSFWWQAPQGVRVLNAVGCVDSREVPTPKYTMEELLRANVGKVVQLTLKNKAPEKAEILLLPAAEPVARTYTNLSGAKTYQAASEGMLIFRTESGEVMELGSVSEQISALSFAEAPNPPMRKEYLPQLSLQLSHPAPGQLLQVECLSMGMSWTPTYRLDLRDGGEATLDCKVIVENDMVDLEGVQLELATGNPSLGSNLSPSPLTRLNSLVEKASRLSVAMPCAVMNEAEGDDDAEEDEQYFSSPGSRDLFYQTLPDFTCKAGATLARELFNHDLKYAHVYTCRVPAYSGSDASGNESVFHCIRLINNTPMPWSAGSVVCYRAGRFVARTEVPYTAVGRERMLRLGDSAEVLVESESESFVGEKKISSAKINQKKGAADEEDDEEDDDDEEDRGEVVTFYKGSILVTNTADHEVELQLTKDIRGRVTKSSEGAKVSETQSSSYSRRNGDKNPSSKVVWSLRLAPGEKTTCTYTYFMIKR